MAPPVGVKPSLTTAAILPVLGREFFEHRKPGMIEPMRRVCAQSGIFVLAFSLYASGSCLVSCDLGDCERSSASHSEAKPASCHHPKEDAPEPAGKLCSLAFVADITPSASRHLISCPCGDGEHSLHFDAAKPDQILPPVLAAFLFEQDVGPPRTPRQIFSILRI